MKLKVALLILVSVSALAVTMHPVLALAQASVRPASATPPTSPPPIASQSPAVAPADQGPHFTLAQAIAAMAHGHPLIVAARLNVRSAEYGVRAAGLWTNPQLTVGYTRSVTGFSAYDERLGNISVGVTQLFELANLPGARQAAAEYEHRAVVEDGRGTYRGLLFDLATAFFALVEANSRINVQREMSTELGEAARVVNLRVSAGQAPHYDLSRMAVALADARSQVGDAEADTIAARGTLDVAVGPEAASLPGMPEFDLVASSPLPPLTDLLQMVPTERADIAAARHRVQEAYSMITIARRSVFQGIAATFGTAIGAGPSESEALAHSGPNMPGGAPQVDFFVSLAMPLPFVDHGQGTIPAAEQHAMAAAETLNALRTAAQQRVVATYNEVVRRREALQAFIDTGAAESFALRREAQLQYAGGRIQILDLVDAFTSVRDARLRLLTLALDARNAEVSLWRATGAMLAEHPSAAPVAASNGP